MTAQTKSKCFAVLGTYFRAFVAGALAVYMATGEVDLHHMGMAGLAAVVPPIMRWANPHDSAIGKEKAI